MVTSVLEPNVQQGGRRRISKGIDMAHTSAALGYEEKESRKKEEEDWGVVQYRDLRKGLPTWRHSR